ncbi:MAG: YsnF/AvaK domain-containing protein [Steroidobacteraceae bacterium]
MSPSVTPEASIPLVKEHVTVDKHVVETGRVRIRTVVDERLLRVAADLERDDVTVERVPVNREVAEPPQTCEEDGVLIVPILEEVAVVEKRLFLKEELHIHRNRKRERVEEAVRVKSMRPEVQRVAFAASGSSSEQHPERRAPTRATKLRRKERLTNSRK